MNNKEILTSAIEQAEKSGFNIYAFGDPQHSQYEVRDSPYRFCKWKLHECLQVWFWGFDGQLSFARDFEHVLFSHDFAKAFWGEKRIAYEINERGDFFGGELHCFEGDDHTLLHHCEEWKHHLQQMALEEDPIKYLEQFLK